MKQPYFQERTLPSRVEKFMNENKYVDVEEMTEYLISNYREFKGKNKKAFMKSVEKAYEWQLYCQQQHQEEDSCEDIEDSDGGGPDIMEISKTYPPSRGKNTNAMLTKMYKSPSVTPTPKPKKNEVFYVLDPDGDTSLNGSRTPNASARKKRKKENEKERDGSIEEMIKRKKKHQFLPEAPTITFASMAGIKSLKRSIRNLLVNLRFPDVLQPLVKSALVTGPSGSGKTTFAQALAGTAKATMVRVIATDLIGGVSGESEDRITEVFEQVVALAPCVLLLEKLDVVTPKEGTTKGLERRICIHLSSCLANLKSKHKDKQVLVLGETSCPERLDGDLRASFDLEVFMAVPSKQSRAKILKLLCKGCVVEGDLKEVAYRTPGYVAGDLKKLVEKALSQAWERKQDSLDGGSGGGDGGVDDEEDDDGDGEEESSSIVEEMMSHFGHMHKLCEAEEHKSTLTITMEDLMEAMLHTTPALKREGFPTVPDVTWQDIGGLEDIKRELREKILEPIKYAKLHEEFGANRSNGVLMWGPPGCGKTLLAKAVANEAGVNLLPVMGPELLNMYQGESERAVREVFHRARNVAPCVIFFDEFDSLCPTRSKGEQGGSKTTIVNTLLAEMNGFTKRNNVYLIAATNRPDILDPAVTRPGRFDTHLYIDVPDHKGRISIFQAVTKNGTSPTLAPDVDFEELSRLCDNFSGADCDQLVYLASKEAIREVIYPSSSSSSSSAEKRLVSRRHFSAALGKMKPSISAEEQRRYKKLYSKIEGGRVQGTIQGLPEDIPPLAAPPLQDNAQPMDVAEDKGDGSS